MGNMGRGDTQKEAGENDLCPWVTYLRIYKPSM